MDMYTIYHSIRNSYLSARRVSNKQEDENLELDDIMHQMHHLSHFSTLRAILCNQYHLFVTFTTFKI